MDGSRGHGDFARLVPYRVCAQAHYATRNGVGSGREDPPPHATSSPLSVQGSEIRREEAQPRGWEQEVSAIDDSWRAF